MAYNKEQLDQEEYMLTPPKSNSIEESNGHGSEEEFHDEHSNYTKPSSWRTPRWTGEPRTLHSRSGLDSFSWRTSAITILSAICGYLFCFVIHKNSFYAPSSGAIATSSHNALTPSYTLTQAIPPKPDGVKVYGFIFYGRPMFVNILDCYLRKNLVVNGGYLDEVIFIANTKHEEDLEYLSGLIEEVPQYTRINQTGPWTELWKNAKHLDPEAILIKIDDDVVYIADDAIPNVVNTLIAHPEAYAVAGNIINTPHSHFWQYHTGAILPYLPENASLPLNTTPSWRASLLPQHPTVLNRKEPAKARFNWNANRSPLYDMTRWLPLEHTSAALGLTPATNSSWPSPRGGATMLKYADEISSWQMAAQVHYSFLDNLERNNLPLYTNAIGGSSGIWDMQYERYSINFLAIRAGDIANRSIWLNDEVAVSMWFPDGLKRPFLVDTRAVVSHYSFSTQHQLLKTDLLPRYLSLANEGVCGAVGVRKEMLVSSMVRSSHTEREEQGEDRGG